MQSTLKKFSVDFVDGFFYVFLCLPESASDVGQQVDGRRHVGPAPSLDQATGRPIMPQDARLSQAAADRAPAAQDGDSITTLGPGRLQEVGQYQPREGPVRRAWATWRMSAARYTVGSGTRPADSAGHLF